MLNFTIKKESRYPPLEATLGTSKSGGFVGASVRFRMMTQAQSVIIDAAVTTLNETTGEVTYNWNPGETDTAGTFWGEFTVTFADGTPDRIPNRGFINIVVTPEVENG